MCVQHGKHNALESDHWATFVAISITVNFILFYSLRQIKIKLNQDPVEAYVASQSALKNILTG